MIFIGNIRSMCSSVVDHVNFVFNCFFFPVFFKNNVRDLQLFQRYINTSSCFLRIFHLYLSTKVTGRRDERRLSICWLTPQIAAMAGTKYICSQMRASSGSPKWVQGCRDSRHPLLLSRAISRELGLEWSCWDNSTHRGFQGSRQNLTLLHHSPSVIIIIIIIIIIYFVVMSVQWIFTMTVFIICLGTSEVVNTF